MDYDFKIGEFRDTSKGFDNPLDWIESSLIEFCHFISLEYPDGLKPADKKDRAAHDRKYGLLALKECHSFIKAEKKYKPRDEVSTLDGWFKEAILGFLFEQFKVIPSKWWKGTPEMTDKYFSGIKLEALRIAIDRLEKENKPGQ